MSTVLLGACAPEASPTIDPAAGSEDVADEVAEEQEVGDEVALAPSCGEVEPVGYDPPPGEQPDPDPAITTSEPLADGPPIDSSDDGYVPSWMEQAMAWGAAEAPEHYAGVWLDNRHGATVIAFTADVEDYAAEVRERFGAGWWVVHAPRSETELTELSDRIFVEEEMDGGWSEDGPEPGRIVGSGPSIRIGRVSLTVFEPDDARITELSERYGADRICWEAGEPGVRLGG